MNLTPRGDEIAAVAELLESDDFDSADELAKAIIKRVAKLLWFRDWYVVGARGELAANFGPFLSEADAAKWGQYLAGKAVPPDWGVAKVFGMGRIATNATEGRLEGGGYGYCVTEGCGCPPYAHLQDGSSRGKCLLCKQCDKYQQSLKKAPAKRAKKETS